MSSGKTLRAMKNALIQGTSQIITWGLTWALLIVLPKELGDANFGRYFFAISYCTMFGTLMNLGINTWLAREIAIETPEHDDLSQKHQLLKKITGNVYSIKLILTISTFIAQSLLLYTVGKDTIAMQAAIIIGISFMFDNLTYTAASVLLGLERMFCINLAGIISKIIITVGAIYLLLTGHNLLDVCWIHVAASVVSMIIVFAVLHRTIPISLGWDKAWMKRIIHGGLPFLIWTIFSEIYLRIDVIMLKGMTSDSIVGWYGAGFRLYNAFMFLPHIFNTVFFPPMTRVANDPDRQEDFKTNVHRLLNLMLLVATPVSIVLFILAKPALLLLYGESPFLNAAPCLQLFSISLFLTCIDVLLATILVTKNKEKQWSYMAIIAAMFNPAMNAWMIPWTQNAYGNGGIGAALATVITEILMMIAALFLLPKGILSFKATLPNVGKALLAGAAMAATVYYVPDFINLSNIKVEQFFNLAVRATSGGIVFLICVYILKFPPKEDIAHLVDAIRKR
jgi:O-antigen/teichoic acid export membrane protein